MNSYVENTDYLVVRLLGARVTDEGEGDDHGVSAFAIVASLPFTDDDDTNNANANLVNLVGSAKYARSGDGRVRDEV